MPIRPGGELAARPLHFIWIADCSGSMRVDGKIQALNHAIKSVIPAMVQVADDNPHAEVLVRAVKFSTGASWHVAQPAPIGDFKWTDLSADGITDMGKAFTLVAEQLKMPPMSERALPPVLVLISDGQPTDDYRVGLKAIMDQPWGVKSVRIAIAIPPANDNEMLQEFIGHSELRPLVAETAEQLVKYIKWASTAVLRSVTTSKSQFQADNARDTNILLPPLPADSDAPSSPKDVW